MENTLKHIKENTEYIDAEQLTTVFVTSTHQIACSWNAGHGTIYHGEIQKIYLDKNGEAVGYDVYIY